MKLKDRVAVITGSARGIGRATAEAMAREGAIVVVSDRDAALAGTTASEIGGRAIAIAADVSDAAQIERLFETAVARLGRVDILVNNAGIGSTELVVDISLETWERILRINLTGAFLCSQQFARLAIKRGGGGKIVNIVSLSGQKGGVGRSAYGASKAGLEVLNKIMAVEFADHGINVNAIAPGPIATETGKGMHTRETVEAYHRLIPQRRYGEPEEIAVAAVFLASDDAAYITGHTLNVDGGFLAAGLMFPFDPAVDKPVGAGS
ncbi:SDR family NAD(P)-dependent oxidoreductase [Lichenicoccus roseus]|uniref:3-oxoacyl-ACP reductase FabG n=1 Tax=Lichenicoccus roseus TaxID=2683649 RepID=A0A5R9J696_9PROT|nr:3-oxoacyl-ACP reductase family protein [Lichenicoccus roseus]TLU70886.1 3-oxoacyl-ACP reductase FabG [Lichenicoccus roseus]